MSVFFDLGALLLSSLLLKVARLCIWLSSVLQGWVE